MVDQCRDWTKTQFQASYKGVEFEVNEDAREFGRRNALHEFPDRESWLVEDMGIATKIIHVVGFVYGDKSDVDVARLEAACSSPGAGLLVLPNRPAVLAYANPCVSNWNAQGQGKWECQLEFIERPFRPIVLFGVVFLAGAVAISLGVGVKAALDLFSIRFDSVMRRFSAAAFVPAVARDTASVTIGMVADALDQARRLVVMDDTRAAADVETLVRQMKADRIQLAYQGQKPDRIEAEVFVADADNVKSGFGGNLAKIFEQMAKGSTVPDAMVRALETMVAFQEQTIDNPYDALSVRAERALTAEVGALTRRLALLYLAQAITQQKFGSRGDAVTARANIAELFDNTLEAINDVDCEAAFIEARNAAVRYLSQTAAELPALVYIDCKRPLPAPVLATLLYNDASRDMELVDRNHAEDPLFMPLRVQAIAPEANRRGL